MLSRPALEPKRNTTGLNGRIQQATQLVLEEANPLLRINHLLIHPLTQGIQHLIRGLNAGISPQEQCFEVVEDLRGQRVIAEILEQTGNETLTGLFQAAAKTAQPVNFLKRDLINTTSLGGENLGRPSEILIKVTKTRFLRIAR